MNQNHAIEYSGIGLPAQVRQLKEAGYFDHAIRIVDEMLAGELPACMRQNLLAQREMMLRLPGQFPYTKEAGLALVREKVPDFTMEELERLMDKGRITWIFVNGEERLLNSFFDTLCKGTELAGRLPKAPEPPKNANHELLDRTGRQEKCIHIMQEKGHMGAEIILRHTVRVKDEYFVPGETYRVWIPLPAECIQQSDIKILDCYGEPAHIAAPDADTRTIYWEETMTENHPFWVEYSYKHVAPYVDPSKVKADPVQPTFDTEEIAPHIVFTPYIKALCAELTEGVTDPIEKARRFYDFVTTKAKYSFMPDYFVLPQIPDACLKDLRGDCGVLALAFITLCRCAGIPAKWQSGQVADPDLTGSHDWAMFYVAPYGWMFADCSFGGSAFRAGSKLRHNHYFGNLDVYRNVTTNRFQADFDPPSRFWRHDPYDNQQGEVEDSKHGYKGEELDRKVEMISLRELDD